MNKITVLSLVFLVSALTLLAGCRRLCPSRSAAPPTPLRECANVNLIFVVSEDLAYQASGDVNPKTANLTSGFTAALQMGTFLKQQVLGTKNVTGITRWYR